MIHIPTASRRIGALNFAVQERMPALGFIATQILTPTLVTEMESTIRQLRYHQFNVYADVNRGPGGAFNRIGVNTTSFTYKAKVRGIEAAVDRALRRQYMAELDFLSAQAEQVMRSVLLDRELRVKALIHNTSNFPLTGSTGLDAATAWSSVGADVIGDVATAKKARLAAGVRLTHMQVDESTWIDLWRNTAIRNSFVNTTPATVPLPTEAAARRMMAQTLGLEEIVVGNAIYSADHEESSPSVSSVWGTTYAFLFAPAPAGDPSMPGVGRMPFWATENDDGAGLGVVEYYPSESTRGEVVRAVDSTDEILITNECGYLVKID